MLMTAVVLPEAFAAGHFADPAYHLNIEVFLRGIDSNGLILVDTEERLYDRLCDNIEPLANLGKGKTTHALFEELLKTRRQKVIRFVTTECSFNRSKQIAEIAMGVAVQCKPDSVLVDPVSRPEMVASISGSTKIIPVPEYIGSKLESERRRWCESLPSVDRMPASEFDKLVVRSARFSKWLRIYDKQIGKGGTLSHFRRGIAKILALWMNAAHFPKDQLQAEIFTVVDESSHRQFEPSVAYHRVKGDLVEPLQEGLGLPIKLSFKRDEASICHARHLQTQSVAILFDRGFDFVEKDGSLRRNFIKLDGGCAGHLQEYRQLPEYVPGTGAGTATTQ